MKVVTRGFSRRLADHLQTVDGGEDPLELLQGLVDIIDRTDSYRAGHTTRVAEIASSVARLADCSLEEVDLVRRAALAHDIGKVGIPEKVLRKHGPLTADEMHLIRLHPIFGASMLARLGTMDDLIPAVLHHHERWDGGGYPAGLSSTDIPKAARIISVADAYDAMTSYRTYGNAMTAEEALTEMRACSGTQFDPMLVDAMHDAYLYGVLAKGSSSMSSFPQTERALA